MDEFTRSFAQEAAIRQIDNCTSIDELKALTKTLLASHFQARSYIATLLWEALPFKTDGVPPEGEQESGSWRQG